jgi:F-type H+-transporting ATPase subunit epsilon
MTTMAFFSVDIITPNKVLAQDIPADSLLVPTSRGEINILPDHTHILTKLGTGSLMVYSPSGLEDRSFFISEGICKVLREKVLILAEVGEESKNIDLERAKRSMAHCQELLKTKTLSSEEFEEITQKLERAKLRVFLTETYAGKISD